MRPITLLVLGILLFVTIPAVSLGATPTTLPPLITPPASGYETPVIVRPDDQMEPVIHGQRIVWQDGRNGDISWDNSEGDIYSYNLSSHIEQPEGASTSSYGKWLPNDYEPVISGAGIFWVFEGRSDGDTNNEILGRTLGGKPVDVTVVVGGGMRHIDYLAIDGNRLVYVVDTNDGNCWLVLFDISTRHIYSIRQTDSHIRSPDIDGERIVWQELDGNTWTIYGYSLTGGEVNRLSWGSGDHVSPVIDGTTVVWAGNPKGNWDLYTCDFTDPYSTGATLIQAPGDQTNPQISGGRVVWQDNRNGNWDIYTKSLSGGAVATVCTVYGDQVAPVIDGDRIVWQDKRSGDWDIYMFTVSSSAPAPVPTPARLVITSPGTYSITADGFDGRETPIEIRSSNVVLDGGGFTIDGSDQPETCGIRIVGGGALLSNVVVRNIRLTNWEMGILADGITGSVIEGSEMAHNEKGIVLEDAQDVQVRYNRFFANDVTGIAVTESGNTIVQANIVWGTGDGFRFFTGDNTPVSVDDVLVSGSSGTRISDNDLGGDYNSVNLDNAISTRITGNRLKAAHCGISALTTNEGIVVVDNVFSQSGYAVYGNFVDTVWNTTPSPGPNVKGGPQIGGNYWAGFSETNIDANGDGFCDEPYEIPMGGTDLLPLAPWSGPVVVMVPGGAGLPTDINDDGKYDDVNGNGRKDFADVVLYFNQMTWIASHEPVALFDYNGNGRIDFADVVWLFNNL